MKASIVSRLWNGNINKKELRQFSIISILSILLSITLSWILYPKELNYSIFTHMLSYLGNNKVNPNGWFFFSMAMFFFSISLHTLNVYIYHRIKYASHSVSLFSVIVNEFGALCLILVAFFPDVYEQNFFQYLSLGKIHNILAVTAFFCLYAGLLGYAAIFTIDHYPNLRQTENSIFPKIRTRPFFIFLGVVGIMTLISVILVKRGVYEWPGPGLMSFTFWEWILAITILVVFYRIVLGIPNKHVIPELAPEILE